LNAKHQHPRSVAVARTFRPKDVDIDEVAVGEFDALTPQAGKHDRSSQRGAQHCLHVTIGEQP
jgi:hypothetical protein